MLVALGTADGQPEKHDSRRIDPVYDRLDPELLGVSSPFLIDEGITMKAGGNPLLDGCVSQEIAGDLLDRKLVEGLVVGYVLDHPIAVLPDAACEIAREAV